MIKRITSLFLILLVLCLILGSCGMLPPNDGGSDKVEQSEAPSTDVVGYASVEGIPDYSGEPYVVLNENQPEFTETEITETAYEFYSDLDSLGRCGITHACVGKELMPTEDRGEIGSVRPSGWVNRKYDADLVDGGYIYNRCHLIGFQLTGENANKENLITGTRYMNVDGMLPFENMVADYVKETGNHVMYRVTPIFVGDNLVASGVKMEAYSVEDGGEGICFNVFCYNVQPGITINYANGENWLNGEESTDTDSETETETQTDTASANEERDYILNVGTKRIHLPSCPSVSTISPNNKHEYHGTKQALLDQNYTACGSCKP